MAGGIAARALLIFVVLLVASAVFGAVATEVLLSWSPIRPQSVAAIRAGLDAAGGALPQVAPLSDWLKGLVPANPLRAAVEDAMVPLVVFALLFGFAAARLRDDMRERLVGFFQALAEAMLVLVHWVLLVGPVGVFALAFSTQSSLAALPAMVEGAQQHLGVPSRVTGLVLPLAVSLFRYTSPAANLAVVLYLASFYGIEPSVAQVVAAVCVAAVVSLGAVSLPGQVSFFASCVPISMALGVPIAGLPLLLAVESIPDIFRTVGNVTADVAVTGIVARRQAD